MILEIYSIKDTKVGAFKTPFYAQNEAVAIRSLKNAVNDQVATELTLNTEDFQLYKLGIFNDLTGEINKQIKFVINAIDLKNAPRE